jgi:hypothetical protein
MSTRDFSWGKGGRCVRLTTYHPRSVRTSRKSGALTYLELHGPTRPVVGEIYLTLVLSVDVARHFVVKDKIVSEPKDYMDYLQQAHVGSEDKYAYIFSCNECLILERESRDSCM